MDDEGVSINSPIPRKKWSRGPGIPEHDLVSRPTHIGMWNAGDNGWTKTKTEYIKLSVLPEKRRSEPIATSIRRLLCAHNVMGYIFLTVVTKTREF